MKRITLDIQDKDFKKIKDMFTMDGCDFEKDEEVIRELFFIECSFDSPLELKEKISNVKIKNIWGKRKWQQ